MHSHFQQVIIESDSSYEPFKVINETDSAGRVQASLSKFRHIRWPIDRITMATSDRSNRIQISVKKTIEAKKTCELV